MSLVYVEIISLHKEEEEWWVAGVYELPTLMGETQTFGGCL